MPNVTQQSPLYVLRVLLPTERSGEMPSAVNDLVLKILGASIKVRCHLVCLLKLRIMAIFEQCPAALKAGVR